MNPSSSRIERDAIRYAYPLPRTSETIKALDRMDQKRRRALRWLVLLGVAGLLVLSWVLQ